MEKAARQKLKQFLEDNFAFEPLKKAGFFGKDIRKTDYEKIAARICWYFGYNSIYEHGPVCRGVSCNGKCKQPSQYCKSYNPHDATQWGKLYPPDESELVSQDQYLN